MHTHVGLSRLTSDSFNVWFGEYMHFCYFSFYFILGGTWPLIWLLCPREHFDRTSTGPNHPATSSTFQRKEKKKKKKHNETLTHPPTHTVVTLTYLACLGSYLIMPAKGPFWAYGPPAPEKVGLFFSFVTHAIDESASSRGTAMPSAHCGLTVANWLCAMLYLWPLAAVYLLIAPGLVFSTSMFPVVSLLFR